MKKLTIICSMVLSLWAASLKGQITLDQIVDQNLTGFDVYIGYNFFTAQISTIETKYVFCDTLTNTFSLYNMDFTPFMTHIPVPQPFNNYEYQVMYITRTLFDCDTSNIEFAYEAPINNNKTFYVSRTDGTILLQVDSANGPYCIGGCQGMSDYIRPIRNTSDGTKLFLQKYNLGYGQFYIYSLCGTLSTDVFDFSDAPRSFVKIYPNPTASTLTFQINPPDNFDEYELVLLDNGAKEVKRQKINSPTGNYTIDVSTLSSGTYYYSLCTKTKAYQTGKFIIVK